MLVPKSKSSAQTNRAESKARPERLHLPETSLEKSLEMKQKLEVGSCKLQVANKLLAKKLIN